MISFRLLTRLQAKFYTLLLRNSFGKFGFKSIIESPRRIDGISSIYIGHKVHIAYKSWLAANSFDNKIKAKLFIGSGSIIGNFNHIYAAHSIVIEKNVLTADNVFISDNTHNYSDISQPILSQGVKVIKPVTIGRGTWIGENACILGANIGKNCVIAANSVLTKDIPDYCIAAGVPAKIIKRFDLNTREWKNLNT